MRFVRTSTFRLQAVGEIQAVSEGEKTELLESQISISFPLRFLFQRLFGWFDWDVPEKCVELNVVRCPNWRSRDAEIVIKSQILFERWNFEHRRNVWEEEVTTHYQLISALVPGPEKKKKNTGRKVVCTFQCFPARTTQKIWFTMATQEHQAILLGVLRGLPKALAQRAALGIWAWWNSTQLLKQRAWFQHFTMIGRNMM